MIRLHLLLWLVVITCTASAQQFSEKYFDHYTIANGLSDNTVVGITQDQTGYVWIATYNGLNRFNGSRFVQFHSTSDSLSLPSEDIVSLSWLDKNRLGVATSGFHIIDTKTCSERNVFIPYHNKQYQYKFNMVERAIGDEQGNLYILTRSGFYHYDKDYHLISRFDFYKEKDVPLTHFFFGREFFELDVKRFLVITVDGLYIYDKDKKKLKKMVASDCPALADFIASSNQYFFFQNKPGSFFILKPNSDSIIYVNALENKKVISRLPFKPGNFDFHYRTKLVAESDTSFYLTGHNSGFYKLRFYPESGRLQLHPEKYFPNYLCTGILRDKQNNLWIATNRGVFRQNPYRSQVEVVNLPTGIEDKFPNIMLDDIYVADGKIYAAAKGGAGLFVYDKASLQFEKQIFFGHDESYDNSIRAIVEAGPRHFLLATNGNMILFDRASQKGKVIKPSNWMDGEWASDFVRDNKGNIWIAAYHNYKYDPITKTFTTIPNLPGQPSVPSSIETDNEGNVWMAGHGVARYNASANRYDLQLDSFPFVKMPDKQSGALAISGNIVWFGSNNNGLIGYDIKTKKFYHYSRSNGLPDDNIVSTIVVNNKLWIACYSGIACLDLQTHQLMSFGKEDGFPDMQVLKGARFFYDTELNQLYLGLNLSFVRFQPDLLLQKKSPPQTFIENVVINSKKSNFLPGETITTSWKDNELRVLIGTINFIDGNSQRFAYRIVKDENTPWTQLGAQPSFSIYNLSPGKHRIQVKAYSPNNRWKEQVKEITIVVTPPLWQTDWFIALTIVIGIILIYLLIKWRTGLVQRKEMEKTQVEKIKADHYKSQYELEQISNYFSSSLADKKSEEDVLWDVAQNLIGRMNYEDCIIYLWNEDGTKMVQKAAYGPKGKPEVISNHIFEVMPGQGIVGHVIDTRQPVIINDTRTDKRYRVDDQFRLSEVCVPIIHDDELLGVIDSEHSQAGYFSERDVQILTTIATLIGNKLKQISSEQSLDAKQKELANINEQLVEARLSALQAQMNPHFVFNALNSIKRMILDGDNEKASRYLSKFALMIRMTLNHSKETFVTLDENIEYLKAYLEMEQLRFDDSFTYSIYVSQSIDVSETTIPSMMIQPLVENAIWHGLMQSEGEKKIKVKFIEHQNKLTCIVEDNGIGIRQSQKLKEKNKTKHQSVGLENLRKRIKIMNDKYDMGCSLEIMDLGEIDKDHQGTRVVLQFNLINV